MPELPLLDTDAPPVLVSETFTSLQGEGALTGVPSWFCRLSGCNLRCRWCDTPYASWSPEGDKRTVQSLVDEAVRTNVKHAVLTGGEPMIFPQLAPLTHALAAAGVHITIETAGTVDRRDIAFDLMSLSPKLSNSTPANDPRDPTGAWAERHEQRRINPETIQSLIDRSARTAKQFKFVVTSKADLAEIDDLLGNLTGIGPGEVFLMPEGVSTPDPASVKWVVDLCLERGWRYGHRLHIELFGDTKGT